MLGLKLPSMALSLFPPLVSLCRGVRLLSSPVESGMDVSSSDLLITAQAPA